MRDGTQRQMQPHVVVVAVRAAVAAAAAGPFALLPVPTLPKAISLIEVVTPMETVTPRPSPQHAMN